MGNYLPFGNDCVPSARTRESKSHSPNVATLAPCIDKGIIPNTHCYMVLFYHSIFTCMPINLKLAKGYLGIPMAYFGS